MLGRIALLGGLMVVVAGVVFVGVVFLTGDDRAPQSTSQASPDPVPVETVRPLSPPVPAPPSSPKSATEIARMLGYATDPAPADEPVPRPVRRKPPPPIVVAARPLPAPEPEQFRPAPPPAAVAPPPPASAAPPPPEPEPPIVTAARPPPQQPVEERARPDPAVLLTSIDPIVNSVPCAVLDASLKGGIVDVRGFVYDRGSVTRMRSALASLDGVGAVRLDVRDMNADQCRLVKFFSAYLGANRGVRDGLAVRSRVPDAIFTLQERLVLDLKAPAANAYIYVDYFDLDGNVVHLLPSEAVPGNRMRGNAGRVLGEGPGNGEWVVGGPLGTELIVALAAPEKLFAAQRKDVESAAVYLKELERRFALIREKYKGDRIAADILFVTTAATR